ncbi:hypothetical protein HPB51_007461 [Rhipicephalus microplus]|uniref:Uncharacterized protein n=1 Tax=Rhipicephalus microplus TaxID=6941 RepID=A0A9J6E113_RHIMP|nr:hypothetical protein HPB51_007461 [Rhipicephalus microplus]
MHQLSPLSREHKEDLLALAVQRDEAAARALPPLHTPHASVSGKLLRMKHGLDMPKRNGRVGKHIPSYATPTSKPSVSVSGGLTTWPSECYGVSRDGTHIALSLCTEDEVSIAKRSNLAPGQSCGLVNRMTLVLKTNPERYFHARIVRTLSEAGLVTPHRRRLHRNIEDAGVEEDSGHSSVRLFFFVYLAGCALPLSALACEIFWHRRKQTRVVSTKSSGARNDSVAEAYAHRIMSRHRRLEHPHV